MMLIFDEFAQAVEPVLSQHGIDVKRIDELGRLEMGGTFKAQFARTYLINTGEVGDGGELEVILSGGTDGIDSISVWYEGVWQSRADESQINLITDLFNSLSIDPITACEFNEFIQSSHKRSCDDEIVYWNEYPEGAFTDPDASTLTSQSMRYFSEPAIYLCGSYYVDLVLNSRIRYERGGFAEGRLRPLDW
jgi:hypothetical protein